MRGIKWIYCSYYCFPHFSLLCLTVFVFVFVFLICLSLIEEKQGIYRIQWIQYGWIIINNQGMDLIIYTTLKQFLEVSNKIITQSFNFTLNDSSWKLKFFNIPLFYIYNILLSNFIWRSDKIGKSKYKVKWNKNTLKLNLRHNPTITFKRFLSLGLAVYRLIYAGPPSKMLSVIEILIPLRPLSLLAFRTLKINN